jgi:hypothetical protein
MPAPASFRPGPPFRRRRTWGPSSTTPPVGGRAAPPVLIPYEWILTPMQRRPTNVINSAAISQFDAATAYSTDPASIARYGVGPASATLTTAVDADAANLAAHLTTYYNAPRPRQPVLAFDLIDREDEECHLILSVGLAQRAQVIHAPTTWPVGAANFLVEGIHHVMSVDQRIVEWSTAALIGTSPVVADSFTREISGGWGNADTGQTWNTVGTASDFTVSLGMGRHLHSVTASMRESYIDTGKADWDLSIDLSWPVNAASGATLTRWICGRYTNSNNYYVCRLDLNTAGAVSMQLGQRVAGTFTTLVSSTTVDATYTANAVYRVRFTGSTTLGSLLIAARAWIPAIEVDPGTALLTYQDSAPALTSGTNVAVLDRAEAGNTNVPVTLSWDNATAYIGGNPQGTSGPWFRRGTSIRGGSDLRPF